MTVEVRSDGGGWKVTVHGTTHSHHRLKRRAVAEGRRVARERGATLRIQGADGRWQDVRGY